MNDKKEKITWLILNFHSSADGGNYLASREEDSRKDRNLQLLSIKKVCSCRFVGFLIED